MARVEPVLAQEEKGMIEEAGDAMLLMVNRALWETLTRQSAEEGRRPGEVLVSAMRLYLEAYGSEDAVGYMHTIAGTQGASGDG